MTSVSISQLRVNPSDIISRARDYPVAVQRRNKTQAYLVGSELYEKLVALVEDSFDRMVVGQTDFSKGKDFETVAKSLGI